MNIQEDKFYTTAHIAELLGKNIETIRRYCRQGMLKNLVKLPKEYLIPGKSIIEFLDENNPDKLAEEIIRSL